MQTVGRVLSLSAVLFLALAPTAWANGPVVTNTPNLPPCAPAHYVTPDQFHAEFPTANPPFTITAAQHLARDGCGNKGGTPPPVGNGNSTIDNFFSELTVMTNFGSFTGLGPVSVLVTATADPEVFQTEMLSMNISGGTMPPGVAIRESPALPSLGITMVKPLGGGMYAIDSFFDVFTEVSLDGGITWHADANGPGRIQLVPEPSGLALLGFACLALARRRPRAR